MINLGRLYDKVYPIKGNYHQRIISRAIIINQEKEVLLEEISRDDIFGCATYLETPGGGVNDGESLSDAAKREVSEECGFVIEILDEIGVIEDDYNLINRHNISNYFLAKIVDETALNREEYEKLWIKSIKFYPIDEAIRIMEKPNSNIAKIVYNREIIILKKVKELLENKK